MVPPPGKCSACGAGPLIEGRLSGQVRTEFVPSGRSLLLGGRTVISRACGSCGLIQLFLANPGQVLERRGLFGGLRGPKL